LRLRNATEDGVVVQAPAWLIEGAADRGDGRIIVSNVVELAIRPLTLNQKCLFAGSDGGAERRAVVASLRETCKLVGVEPHADLADVTSRIVSGHLQRRLDDLLPWAYPIRIQLCAVA
jgi:hypothetical protein